VGGELLIAGVVGNGTSMLAPLQHGLCPGRAASLDPPAARRIPPAAASDNLDRSQAIACSELLLLRFELMLAQFGK